jgi:hypothetical protein
MTKKGKQMLEQIEKTDMSNQKKDALKNMVQIIFEEKNKQKEAEKEDE